MPESEWARRMAQEFKAGKARKAEEDAKPQEEQTVRRESASRLWAEVRGAFKEKARMSNAEVGEEILTWEAACFRAFPFIM